MSERDDDKARLDWLEREQCSVFCWRVSLDADANRDNGWTIGGASGSDGEDDNDPQGATLRDAIDWAMHQHVEGDFRTRADELRDEAAASPHPDRGDTDGS